MPFLNFLFQPKNELESGGRSVAPVQSDASEPEKNCPNCHRDIRSGATIRPAPAATISA